MRGWSWTCAGGTRSPFYLFIYLPIHLFSIPMIYLSICLSIRWWSWTCAGGTRSPSTRTTPTRRSWPRWRSTRRTRDGNFCVIAISQELSQWTEPAPDWSFTLVYPIRTQIGSLTQILTLTPTQKFPPQSAVVSSSADWSSSHLEKQRYQKEHPDQRFFEPLNPDSHFFTDPVQKKLWIKKNETTKK